MVFEVIHPFNLDRIAAGKIEQVYKFGYFLATITCNKPLTESMQFVFHISSPWLLPCGFCAENGIELAVPSGESKATFNWKNYCSKKKAVRLDLSSLLPTVHLKLLAISFSILAIILTIQNVILHSVRTLKTL